MDGNGVSIPGAGAGRLFGELVSGGGMSDQSMEVDATLRKKEKKKKKKNKAKGSTIAGRGEGGKGGEVPYM